jgi:hypothetical protein
MDLQYASTPALEIEDLGDPVIANRGDEAEFRHGKVADRSLMQFPTDKVSAGLYHDKLAGGSGSEPAVMLRGLYDIQDRRGDVYNGSRGACRQAKRNHISIAATADDLCLVVVDGDRSDGCSKLAQLHRWVPVTHGQDSAVEGSGHDQPAVR